MKKIFSSLTTALRTTPFLGRTFFCLLIFFLGIKQIVLAISYGRTFVESSLGTTVSHYLSYLVSDMVVGCVLLLLIGSNIIIKHRLRKLISNVISGSLLLVFALDIFTIYFFQSRISILDIQQFSGSSIGSFASVAISGIFVFLVLGIICFLVIQKMNIFGRQRIFLMSYLIVFLSGLMGISIYAPEGFGGLPDNIISLNITALQKQGQQFLSDSNRPFSSFFENTLGKNKQPNVIVVFAESLSAIDSLEVGGINDSLPYFDMIQQNGITFSNFVTNGCTSDTAHIGFFLGIEPLKLIGSNISPYSGYSFATDPLPKFMNELGYTTTFVSAASLSFFDQRNFISEIGFEHIIGEEYFSGEQTYVFDSAPDHVLYNKTLDVIASQTGPYFVALQTISLHKPYNTPYGKTESEALKYSDKSLYYFYLQLKKTGFFDNGILVIMGDHRKMEPLQDKEKQIFGEGRYARSLATIVGKGIPSHKKNSSLIQHTDFFYSLKRFLGEGRIHVSSIFNNIFSSHQQRDRGLVCCWNDYKNKTALVFDDGSNSSFDNISELKITHPFIAPYLASYIDFQYGNLGSGDKANDLIIIGHRGSPLKETENSLAGFFLAKEQGADGVEFDVSRTKDQKNVVMHGEELYSTVCGNQKKITDYTLAQLQSECPLTNKEPVRTLKDMLSAIDGLFEYYFLEIKVYNPKSARAQTQDAIATVKSLHMEDRVIFISYDETAKNILGNTTGIIAGRDTFATGDFASLSDTDFSYVLMPHDVIRSGIASDTQAIGKTFVTYTVNTTGTLQKLYNEGVRVIMTDNIPLVKERAK